MTLAEAILTLALYVFVLVTAASGLLGLITALIWLGLGMWLNSRTEPRGLLADASFIVTWPFYVMSGR